MGIVDQVATIIRKNIGEDMYNLLRFYETSFPPDWGLELLDGSPGIMDFSLIGGDIRVVGFWYNITTIQPIIDLAIQDLLIRLLVNDTQSKFLSDYGVGPLEDIPKDALKTLIALAAERSPYISEITSIELIDGEVDSIDIRINGVTITGDRLSAAFSSSEVT
jgi:hypothetical protein